MLEALATRDQFPDILVAIALADRADRDQEHFWSLLAYPIAEIEEIEQSGVPSDDPDGVVWQFPEWFLPVDKGH